MQRCGRCKVEKPLDHFDRDSKRKSGRFPYCRPCRLEYAREWRAKNPAKARTASRQRAAYAREHRERNLLSYSDAHRLKKYGGTIDDYERLVREQGGLCAICGRAAEESRPGHPRFHIDHCHVTKTIRGLLCRGCNTALGMMGDDPARMRDAADYVEAHAASLSTNLS